jgi:hypothetical protein
MDFLSPFDWPMGTFLRPVLILVCGMLLFNLPTLIYKISMYIRGVVYFVMCNDKSWKKPQDPNIAIGPLLKSGERLERKTVYFLRHGESTWNDTFNKGSHRSAAVFAVGFIPGLIKALLYELYLILSGKLDRFVTFHSSWKLVKMIVPVLMCAFFLSFVKLLVGSTTLQFRILA